MISLDGRHPSVQHLGGLFDFARPGQAAAARARKVQRECAALAALMICDLPDGPELAAGLRRLIEARDCFHRAALAAAGG